MVREIQIFFEGAPDLKTGFNVFLKPVIDAARRRGIRFQLISCGPIDETVKDFMDAVQMRPDAFNVLLVDSDRPDNGNLIASLKARSTWNNRIGANVQDDQIHFMVQVMESWFLADKEALERYYGRGFRSNRLPQNSNVELVPKNDVIQGLANATRDIRNKRYHKTRHAPDLMQRLDVNKVRAVAPNCDRLFTTLERLVNNT